MYTAMDDLLALIYINQILRCSLLCYKALFTGCLHLCSLFSLTDWLVPKVIRQDGQWTHLEANVSGATVSRKIFTLVLFSNHSPSLCIENLWANLRPGEFKCLKLYLSKHSFIWANSRLGKVVLQV